MILPQNQLTKGHSISINSITHSQRYLPHTVEIGFYALKLHIHPTFLIKVVVQKLKIYLQFMV